MAATAIDRFNPANFLAMGDLVTEGQKEGMKQAACVALQTGAAAAAAFAMETWGDKAHVAGIPADVVAGLGLGLAGFFGLPDSVSEGLSEYVMAAGCGFLANAGSRLGREFAIERLHKIARSQVAAPAK